MVHFKPLGSSSIWIESYVRPLEAWNSNAFVLKGDLASWNIAGPHQMFHRFEEFLALMQVHNLATLHS